MFLQAEEYVNARSNWVGCLALRSEVRDSLTLDGVLLVFQGKDDLYDILKLLDWGVWGEESVADKGNEFEEGTGLDGPAMELPLV